MIVQAAPLIQSLHLAVTQTLNVNVTLGTRGQMEPHARHAALARISLDRGLFVQAVPFIQYLQLEASKTPPASVMQGIQGKMQAIARSAVSINTKKAWDLQIVLPVQRIPSLQVAASQT